jgi:hypothetical protein
LDGKMAIKTKPEGDKELRRKEVTNIVETR